VHNTLLGTVHIFNTQFHQEYLVIPKVSHSPTDAILLILENTKIYIKTCIKIAATRFGLRPSSGGLHLSLAKVTLILKQSVKFVVMCYVVVWHQREPS
jgi:hypothetical protein